jgi:integrase/recombinase XerC
MYPEIEQFKSWLSCQYPTSSTSVHYSSDLVLFFAWARKPLAEISVQDVNAFITHCQQKGQAASSINRRLAALNTFYYFLSMTEDQPPVSPVRPRRHYLPKSRPLPRDAQDQDLERLFSVIESPREKALFLLMLEGGLRVGEVHKLSLDDIFQGSPPRLRLRGKGDRLRSVYLSSQAQTALQDWLEHRPVTTDRAVFVNRRGKRLTVSGIQFLLGAACRKAVLKLSCHQFRHTFGRRMAEAGMRVTTLQALLGHASLRTTQLYVHLSDPHLQTEYERAIASVLELLA